MCVPGVHSRDHCGLVRAGCAFLLHVCEDETQLHAQMFSPLQVKSQIKDDVLEVRYRYLVGTLISVAVPGPFF